MGRLNPVTTTGFTAIIYAADVALSTTAAAISVAREGIDSIILQNNDAAIVLLIGDSAAQPIKLAVGASITLPFRRIEKIYAKSASGTPSISILALGNA